MSMCKTVNRKQKRGTGRGRNKNHHEKDSKHQNNLAANSSSYLKNRNELHSHIRNMKIQHIMNNLAQELICKERTKEYTA